MATTDPIAIATDNFDYAPGSTAYFTATTDTVGDMIEFSLAHLSEASL